MTATSAEAVLAALETAPDAQETAVAENAPTIVCVTACPAGIAHTYMAAEYLEKAGRKLGVNVVVEKQGQTVLRGASPRSSCRRQKRVSSRRKWRLKSASVFRIPAISVPVAEPLRHAEALIERALALQPVSDARPAHVDTDAKKCVKTELKQALLSGISFAVPLIVAGGTVLAVSVLLAQIRACSICSIRKIRGCGCTANWAAGCSVF